MKINGGVALIEEVPDCHEVIRQIRLFTRPKNIEFCFGPQIGDDNIHYMMLQQQHAIVARWSFLIQE